MLYFVLRRTTILDNPLVSLGLTLGIIAAAAGGVLYILYRKKLIFKGTGKTPMGDGRSEPASQRE